MQEATVVLPVLWRWILGGCGMITALGAAAAIIYKVFVTPWRDLQNRVKALEEKHAQDQRDNEDRFKNDLEIIREHGETMKQLCHGMMVLLDHAATGNSIERCKEARDGLHDYLIEKK